MILDEILKTARKEKVSDVHINRNIHYRVGNKLVKQEYEVNVDEVAQDLLGDRYEEFIKTKNADIPYSIKDDGRYRVSFFRQRNSTAIVFRVINNKIPNPHELDLPNIFIDLIKKRNGLLLFTGATGSGKSTTMASLIDYLNHSYQKHIITIEDPIEYTYTNDKSIVSQRELITDVDSFEDALHGALRQDPDLIMLGELRSKETIQMAMTAAETGHLVVSTLHTNGSASTIQRILNVFDGGELEQVKTQLANNLVGIVSQVLVVDVNGNKKLAYELLINNTAVKNLILENNLSQLKNVIKTNGKNGMILLEDNLKHFLDKGVINKKEYERFT